MTKQKKCPAFELFDSHAEAYQERFMDVAPYHATLDALCSAIVTGRAEVLELACGPGNITKYLLHKRPELRILATDLAPNMLSLAKANNPKADFKLLDCRELLTLDSSFDAIVCGFCLPYLSPEETTQLIKDSAVVLREHGVIYLSTMEDDPVKSGWRASSSSPSEQVYMHYYEADFLTAAMRAQGFTVSHLTRTQTSAADGTLFTDLMIVAQIA